MSRSPKNRTLMLTDDDRRRLSTALSQPVALPETLLRGFDAIVNADMMDCLELIPDGTFRLIIVDPPYNLTKDFGGRKFAARPAAAYEAYLREWLPQVCRKLSADGTLYLCGDWRSSAAMQTVLSDCLTIVNRITWQREKGRGAAHNWKNAMEDIWMAANDPRKYLFNLEAVRMRRRVIAPYTDASGSPKDWVKTDTGNFRDTCPSNFWDDITIPFWSMPENTNHPTQKPEKLYAKLILASSSPGDVVFDPFMGSGTSAVVARKLGRRFCGIEINREYCLLAARRLEIAADDASIQGYSSGVFFERNTRSKI